VTTSTAALCRARARAALDTGVGEWVLPRRHYDVLRRRADGETLKAIGDDPAFCPGYSPYSAERIRQLESEAFALVEARWVMPWRERDVRYALFVLGAIREALTA
jgi:hypothetical protein